MLLRLHHVSLPCGDLEASRRFYRDVVGLEEFTRPARSFEGAWFRVNDGQEFHLIHGNKNATFRGHKPLDSDDGHFAFAVDDCAEKLEALKLLGYREDIQPDDMLFMKARHLVGFAQIFIFDPDRHVIEFNSKY